MGDAVPMEESNVRRTRRSNAGTRRGDTKRSSALEQLEALKRGEGKRADLFEEVVEDAVYDAVGEAEYEALVKRRQAEESFVVDDDGGNYQDWGNEMWDVENSDEEDAPQRRAAKKNMSGLERIQQRSKNKKLRAEKSRRNIDPAFLKATTQIGPGTNNNVDIDDDDDLVNSLLADLDADPLGGVGLKKGARKNNVADIALFGDQSATRQTSMQQAPQRLPRTRITPSVDEDMVDAVVDEEWEAPAVGAVEVQGEAPSPADTTQPSPKKQRVEEPVREVKKSSYDLGVKNVTRTSNVGRKKTMVRKAAPAAKPYVPTNVAVSKPAAPVSNPAAEKEWWDVQQNNSAKPMETTAAVPVGKAPERCPRDEDGFVDIFWFDAFEDQYRAPGRIHLFGKVWVEEMNSFMSVCARVEHPRILYVLPRKTRLVNGHPTDELVNMQDVHSELTTLMKSRKINWKARPVLKKYCFEDPDVPTEETEYLEVHYSGQHDALPSTLIGETFSKIFGTRTPPLENFILDRELMGPCWLRIKDAEDCTVPRSWCKFEINVKNALHVEKIKDPRDTPPLVAMSISLKTMLNRKSNANEVVLVSALVTRHLNQDSVTPENTRNYTQFSAVRKLTGQQFPFDVHTIRNDKQVEICGSERQLLGFLMAKIHAADPDIIVGHNFIGFSLDVLLHRMQATKIGPAQWSKLGRFRHAKMPKLQSGPGGTGDSTYGERIVTAGRLVCDTYVQAKQHVRETNYTLGQLSRSRLKVDRVAIDNDELEKYFTRTADLMELITHTEKDSWLSMSLMFALNMMPLTKQITSLCGNLWSRTLTAGQAERVEYLLLHEFRNLGFIVPDKPEFKKKEDGKKKKKKKGPGYGGGLVLAPKKGFYDTFVLLLDFNSLYPSIIQEYNLCFTTVDRQKGELVEDPNDPTGILGKLPDSDMEEGVLPRLIKNLVQTRRVVKNLMKDREAKANPIKMSQYDIRQKALKLTANSMYGCLGFEFSRFFAKPIAALVTSQGRGILQSTVDLAQNQLNLDVIYGDTDSIMIGTGSKDLAEVTMLGNAVKKEVNNLYKTLEIEIDGVYKTMLLLKKKKYAALMINETIDAKGEKQLNYVRETKGLDLVRRDWCVLSKELGKFILDLIFGGMDREALVEAIHNTLRGLKNDIDTNDIFGTDPEKRCNLPIEKFVITKGLTKNPSDYSDAKSQPHVQVAIRMRQQGKIARQGEHIPYVICKGAEAAASTRAYHPDEVKKAQQNPDESKRLEIDYMWYLSQQIHPPISRLCEPIDGTDPAQLADCLGLDASKYHYTTHDKNEDMFAASARMTDAEKYRDCVKLKVPCPTCHAPHEFSGVFRMESGRKTINRTCTGVVDGLLCGEKRAVGRVWNQVVLALRRHLARYYEGWMICDDQTCRNRTRQLCMMKGGLQCLVPGCAGTMAPEYSSHDLYLQMTYYASLFDVNRAVKNAKEEDEDALLPSPSAEDAEFFDALLTRANTELSKNRHHFVELKDLFSFFKSK